MIQFQNFSSNTPSVQTPTMAL